MESNFANNLEALFSQLENFITTKTVVGEPMHIGETIILPLVDVSFGVGAGASGGKDEKGTDKDSGVGGLGAKITPSAVVVIQNGNIQMINIKNQDSMNKLIDMIPGVVSKLNLGSLFSKKENTEAPMDTEEMEPIGDPLEEYYEDIETEEK